MSVVALLLGVLVVMLGSTVQATGIDDMLDDLRWQSRVLLVFSANENDARAKEFLAAAAGDASCELEERDLVLGHITQSGGSYLGDSSVSAADADGVRKRFRAEDEFLVLLIGKDGGAKAKYRDVPELEEIFRLIDGMPMRRREVRQQSGDCSN